MIAQCIMSARAVLASFALLAISASAQDAYIFVDVANKTHENLISDPLQLLTDQLGTVRDDALSLYTDYASRAGRDLKVFLTNVTGMTDEVIGSMNKEYGFNESDACWSKFEYKVNKIKHDARRSALYSGDSHHKFLLGHMIVFRMHINKSEDYIKKSDKMLKSCGYTCEATPRVKRWRRLALDEIHRVRDDIEHTRKSYRDIVAHARRKLNHFKKQAVSKSRDAVDDYKYCIEGY